MLVGLAFAAILISYVSFWGDKHGVEAQRHADDVAEIARSLRDEQERFAGVEVLPQSIGRPGPVLCLFIGELRGDETLSQLAIATRPLLRNRSAVCLVEPRDLADATHARRSWFSWLLGGEDIERAYSAHLAREQTMSPDGQYSVERVEHFGSVSGGVKWVHSQVSLRRTSDGVILLAASFRHDNRVDLQWRRSPIRLEVDLLGRLGGGEIWALRQGQWTRGDGHSL